MNDKKTQPTDGRRLRSTVSRAKIVAALHELVEAGDLEPSAEAVAEKAGVGLRSVFRHFNDMESLRAEMAYEVEARLLEEAKTPFRGETLLEKFDDVVDRRARAFERSMALRRAGLTQVHRSTVLRENSQRLNRVLRGRMESLLPPHILADRTRVEALDLGLSWESWIRLRNVQNLSVEEARQVFSALVRLLLPQD